MSEVAGREQGVRRRRFGHMSDSIRRHARMKARGIHFADLETSGGVSGALHGPCFIVAGERPAVARVEPILESLAVQGGSVHAEPPGAGHFVKLVHNAIEFGMLQAIGEPRWRSS